MRNLHTSPHQQPTTNRGAGYTFAITSSVFAASATVVGKWNLQEISPLLMSSLIFTIATIAMSAGYVPFKGLRPFLRLSRKGWLWLGLFTGSSWVAIWTFWEGVQRMDPSLAAFLSRSEVLVAIVLGMVLLNERFSRLEMVGGLLSIGGIIVMRLTLRMEYCTGFWLVLLGALFFGITEFVCKVAVRYVEPVVLLYLRNLFMAVVYWIVFIGGGGQLEGLEKVWPGVLALGFFGPIISRLAYLMALKRTELSKVAIISQTQPVFVIVISLAALSQLPTFREIVGGVLLMGGCLLMMLARHKVGVRNDA